MSTAPINTPSTSPSVLMPPSDGLIVDNVGSKSSDEQETIKEDELNRLISFS